MQSWKATEGRRMKVKTRMKLHSLQQRLANEQREMDLALEKQR